MHASSTSPIRIAVVGAGYWGKNLIRNFDALGHLHTICDARPDALAHFQAEYPHIKGELSFEAVLANPDIDAVVLATPSLTHYPLGKQVLQAGKHLYVEKPLATTLKDAQDLVQVAQFHQKTLMVGHLLMYHPAINRVKQVIDSGVLGDLRYIQSDRLNYNHGRNDRNVFWDLAPHDLSVLIYLMNGEVPHVKAVTAQNTSAVDDKIDLVQASFQFQNGVMAHLQTSWMYPKKQVQLLVVGTKASLILDDTLPLANRLVQVHFDEVGHRHEKVVDYLPLEPLRLECQHFVNALAGGWQPQSDDQNGLAVVEVLENVQALVSAI
jgi:UDP-2-acetamido-3-amino-2,3-dideoxy-glucuronate N-acetyltransferase